MPFGGPGPHWEPEEKEVQIPREHAQSFLDAAEEPNWNEWEVLRFYIGCTDVISFTLQMDPELDGPAGMKAEFIP